MKILTFLHASGLDLFNSQLHDYSIASQNREKSQFHRANNYLQSFRSSRMTRLEQQSFDVMEYFVQVNLKRDLSDQFEYHRYLINQFMGEQSEIISFISKYHRIINHNDAEAYLIRVRSDDEEKLLQRCFLSLSLVISKVQRISKAFDQLIDQQIERRHRKIETPRFVLERVIHEVDTFQKQLQTEPNRW